MQKKINQVFVTLSCILCTFCNVASVFSENLQSTNYTIEDASIVSGSEALTSSNYSLISSVGEIAADARFSSGSYEIKNGFPNGIVADVPKITCFETSSNTSTTNCISLPNNQGMQGECGKPGCYNKAKIEIDTQNNPFDTLYLVKVTNITDNISYYLKSDHTLGLTYNSSNYLTKCAIEGKDIINPDCDNNTSPDWNSTLQSTNIFYLSDNSEYQATVSALNGDFTQTSFGPKANTTTSVLSLGFDINIGPATAPESSNSTPYNINLSEIALLPVTTSSDLIWLSMESNNPSGFNLYIKDTNSGLYSVNKNATIPSEDEDLAVDANINGGYGVKIYNGNTTQLTLGPLNKSNTFDTAGIDQVGALSTINKLLFFTNNFDSNKGEILNGKAAVVLKARATANTPISSDYSDDIYFTIVGEF